MSVRFKKGLIQSEGACSTFTVFVFHLKISCCAISGFEVCHLGGNFHLDIPMERNISVPLRETLGDIKVEHENHQSGTKTICVSEVFVSRN